MKHETNFDVMSARDFFDIVVLPQYEDFRKNNSSRRHALLSVVVTYHMFEWANNQTKFTLDCFKSLYADDALLADHFELARGITNGNKHFCSKIKTMSQEGFSSDFNSDFARPLNVIRSDGTKISMDELLEEMVQFWKNQRDSGKF